MSNNKENNFDAIVIGAGMSGGWAAKEFCDKGLKTLLLERGRDVKHIKDYPTTSMQPWEFEHRGKLPIAVTEANPVISRCYAYKEDAAHFFVKDNDHPYGQEKPFDWIRGYQVGGRSIMWARQTQRWSEYDFEGPARDGFAVDWPIRYKDIADWYTYVEKFVGISGNKDGLDILPDGEFLKAWDLSCLEKHFQESLQKKYKDRHLIYGRCAHLTEMKDIFREQGRTLCQSRNICQRGCPYGGYFNANSTLIPWAAKTGNLTLRPHSVVHTIIFDEAKNKAVGVRITDANTKEQFDYFAKVIFINAGTLNTNLLLLNSKSKSFPTGLGNENGLLGKYVAFHNYRGVIKAKYNGLKEYKTEGGRPTGAYIPRFRNVQKQETNFLRGYATGFYSNRTKISNADGIGLPLIESMQDVRYNDWNASMRLMGETIPKAENYVSLDGEKTDEWGVPILNISVDYDDNDLKMTDDFFVQMSEMLEDAGFTNIETEDTKQAPGLDIHEMGGVRMGRDPKTSILNKWNQMHACNNVFVTDGACMTSVSTQNPSLTFMALTARAANYAFDQLDKGEL